MNYNTPPDGYTGAPDELSCNSCHTEYSDNYDAEVQILDLPQEVIMGEVYPIRIRMTGDYGALAGFEVVSLNDNLLNAGTWANLGTAVTSSTSNGRRYAKHSNAPQMNWQAGISSYTFNLSWRPVSVTDPREVNLYVASIFGGEQDGAAEDGFANTVASTTVYRTLSAELVDATRIRCNGNNTGSLTVSGVGGKAPYDYSWSNGASAATISNLGPGNYTVTIADQLDQTFIVDYDIDEPPLLEVAIIVEQGVSCPGDNTGILVADVFGGTPGYTYEWNTGANSAILTSLTGGFYELTVTDNLGCEMTTAVNLNDPIDLVLFLENVQNVDCSGASNGAILVSASGGTPTYEFEWSNGDSGQEISGLSAGNYTVTVIDEADCITTDNFVVQEPAPLIFSGVTIVDAMDSAPGSITISMSGGTQPYNFAWTGPNGFTASSATINNLAPGSYHLTVTDGNGCVLVTGDSPFTVSFLTSTEEGAAFLPMTLFPNPAQNQFTLLTAQAGEVRIRSLQGKLLWSGPVQAGLVERIAVRDWPAGIYTVQLQGDEKVWTKQMVVLH